MKDRMSYLLSFSLHFKVSSLDSFHLDNNISYWYVEKYIQYIININHSLGIDAFVSQACQFSLLVNPIQALQLLQECIKIMPKTGGNGRPGWFLLSISDSFFKRAGPIPSSFCPSIGNNIKILLLEANQEEKKVGFWGRLIGQRA